MNTTDKVRSMVALIDADNVSPSLFDNAGKVTVCNI